MEITDQFSPELHFFSKCFLILFPKETCLQLKEQKGEAETTSLFLHLPSLSTTLGTKSKWRRTAVLRYLDRLEEGNNRNLLKFNKILPIGRKSPCQPHRELADPSTAVTWLMVGVSCSTTRAECAAQHKPQLSTSLRTPPFTSAHFKHTGKIWQPWDRLALYDYPRHKESTRLPVLVHLL